MVEVDVSTGMSSYAQFADVEHMWPSEAKPAEASSSFRALPRDDPNVSALVDGFGKLCNGGFANEAEATPACWRDFAASAACSNRRAPSTSRTSSRRPQVQAACEEARGRPRLRASLEERRGGARRRAKAPRRQSELKKVIKTLEKVRVSDKHRRSRSRPRSRCEGGRRFSARVVKLEAMSASDSEEWSD
eukprot:TRINITY_DN77363_c0_g1_i1.p1 TRINITY_DN77363_c0_g1~~TRINITY_DN77363_c0_g1_i1.p1  ORF type:complete len:202 (-),score=39.37 TRINITY_DN77363_c0_g1_i1:455-1024(-)